MPGCSQLFWPLLARDPQTKPNAICPGHARTVTIFVLPSKKPQFQAFSAGEGNINQNSERRERSHYGDFKQRQFQGLLRKRRKTSSKGPQPSMATNEAMQMPCWKLKHKEADHSIVFGELVPVHLPPAVHTMMVRLQ